MDRPAEGYQRLLGFGFFLSNDELIAFQRDNPDKFVYSINPVYGTDGGSSEDDFHMKQEIKGVFVNYWFDEKI